MYEVWDADPRPVWRVSALLTFGPSGEDAEAQALHNTLTAIGVVRCPRLTFGAGRCLAQLRIRAEDDLQAAAMSLTVLDVAARSHPPLVFGDLLWQSVTRLPHPQTMP